MSKYRSTVLEEDVECMEEAQKEYRVKVAKVYAFHRQAQKVGLRKRSTELCQLAADWQDEAEMVVATTFDLTYLPAQLKRKHKQGVNTDEMHAIIVGVQARHDAAKARLEPLTPRLQKLYNSLK